MELAIKLQQTSVVMIAACLLLIQADRREVEAMPYWYVVSIIYPLVVSAAVFLLTTFMRIWA